MAELDVDRNKSDEGEEKHQVAQLDGSRVPQLTCIWLEYTSRNKWVGEPDYWMVTGMRRRFQKAMTMI